MRVGRATGPVLMRMGDVSGTTVNRASRLTAVARPGTTLLDGPSADELSASMDERFSVRAQTPRPIRGLGLMRPYALTRGSRRLNEPLARLDPGADGPAGTQTATAGGPQVGARSADQAAMESTDGSSTGDSSRNT